MAVYTCYFLGPDKRVVMRQDFEAESDEDALIDTRALYAERATRDGFELWNRERCVYSEEGLPVAALAG
ncbi:MAG TPA: hypothetical protein VGL83_17560 [Stellaceae bacterium]|jgi:hypothetical protein